MKTKHSLEYVKDFFLKNNCLFLDEEYKGVKFLHNYQCSCGNKSKIKFDHFKNGTRCACCGGTKKLTLEYIKNYFIKNNCIFLDDTYENAHYPHNYICECKNKNKINFSNFKKGGRCRKCGNNQTANKQKHKLTHIKKYFLDKKCIFIDGEYINNNFLHNFICCCGNKSKISFSNFKKGRRCRKCAKNGFNTAKPSFVYLVGNHYKQKIGIAGENTGRLEKHVRNFGMELIDKIHFSDGNDAIKLENKILNILKQKNIPHGKQVFNEKFDGVTESWLTCDLEVKTIKELINL